MNNIDYNRLLELKNRITQNVASKNEKKEYMQLLFRNGNISKSQYDNFLKDQNSDDVVNAALTIGGVMLATWLLTKLLEK
jgi:hypothetical protein